MRLLLFLLLVSNGICMAGEYSVRVIGGNQAQQGEWPTMVQLLENSSSGASFHCGGTLLSDSWVLTAAHCFLNDADVLDTSISGRSVLVKSTGALGNGDQISMANIFVHPDYRAANEHDGDVALIELAEAVPNPDLQNLYSGNPAEGQNAVIVGWGAESATDVDAADFLNEAVVPVVDQAVCSEAMGNGDGSSNVTENMICAGYETGGTDTCPGDSGGPLLVLQDGEYRQVGITSWGPSDCGEPGQYGVYTRANSYIEWMQATTGLDTFTPPSDQADEPDETDSSIDSGGSGGLGVSLLVLAGLGCFRRKR